MAAKVLTPDDLEKFKRDLLGEIERLLQNFSGQSSRKWLKSPDVRRLLNISPGTLQNLRVNGSLPYTKIGGVIYYDFEDIQKMLMNNRRQNQPMIH
ncbi:MAG: helix-turn-helix domain-containing protein [Candidatus Cyclobacteriaceae bacterium M3_2C_046]